VSAVAGLHPEMAFDFAVAHREPLDALVDFTSRSRYYPSLAHNSLDPSIVPRIRDYAEKYLAAGSRRSAEQVIAAIEFRIRIRDQRLPVIEAWLAQHPKP
jgi:hypothetical protein